jgi:hypothetical protein
LLDRAYALSAEADDEADRAVDQISEAFGELIRGGGKQLRPEVCVG